MNQDPLSQLKIDPTKRRRPSGAVWAIFVAVAVLTGLALWKAAPNKGDNVRISANSREAAVARAGAMTASESAACCQLSSCDQRLLLLAAPSPAVLHLR